MTEQNHGTNRMAEYVKEVGQQLISQGATGPTCCLVLGGTDIGKTTLVGHLAQQLAAREPVAIVDADIGQSHIGPPTTVGWALAEPAMSDLSALPVRGMYFVGDIAPTGHLLPLIVGISHATQQALQEAQVVIIDTGGFIHDPAAKVLWWQVHGIIKPQMVIAVQRQDELEPILAGIEGLTRKVYRLTCPERARAKSLSQRRKFRAEQLARYFRHHNTYERSLEGVSVQIARPFDRMDTNDLKGRLIALRDKRGCDRALGVVIQWRSSDGVVVFAGPAVAVEEICGIVLGDVRLDLSQL